ncbi:MerR family transcriptional regulator [Nitriliruptoraceae bacterium ZYF776]|nr:MerR family transcriptional regulator [Profundirhabdus halotolerans]
MDAPTSTSHAGRTWTVGEVAALAGVSVRTLHHYDEVGLLPPSSRGANGYRRYGHEDVQRLQRVLFYRELDFGLDQIAELLADEADALVHLRRQRALVLERRARLDRLVHTLEQTMDARRAGVDLTPEEMLEVFGDHDPGAYAQEAEERSGDTDAWAQSQARTARYTKEDWLRIRREQEDLETRLAGAFTGGEPADGEVAMDLAEEARAQIDRWFYDLGHGAHRCLGTMYVTDERFRATYDERAEGLAVWFRDAIHANAARHGVHEDTWDATA